MSELRTRVIEVVRGEGVSGAGWYVDKATGERPAPGSIFYAPFHLNEPYRQWLADTYWALPEPRRDPIVVVLPSGTWFCVDECASDKGKKLPGGWAVSGPIENLSVTPSIHAVGIWHGHLTNGTLREINT